jgi:hypothetical protein
MPEPRRRRAAIDLGCGLAVLTEIGKDVRNGVAHAARCGQRAAVPALRKDAAATKEQPIDATSDADREALHAARQRGVVAGLDDEVQVVGLD